MRTLWAIVWFIDEVAIAQGDINMPDNYEAVRKDDGREKLAGTGQ
jgi:uncharacterized LabA/DUF88 family protein